MAFGFSNVSFIGYPQPIPCAGHAGLGFREASRPDAPAILAHLGGLDPGDRRLRFCATVADSVLERHVARLWPRDGFVLTAHDGPLWPGTFHGPGPVRAVAEVAIAGREAEIGVSVDRALRRRGVGTYLVQTAARLLALRRVKTIEAYTLPENASFLALARTCRARIEDGVGEVTISFDVAELHRAYLCRRAAQVFRPAV